eukprot:c19072_g1_i1.p1 GENE.c19072_g1_i1~~c19072_g1_i1.p1  ORF type:complete len:309 (-),score=83.67 c19072_g1_i1:292-1143(-)
MKAQSAVIVSLGHSLGDGHTFYRIFSFLDKDTPVEALNPVRVVDFEQRLQDKVGRASRSIVSSVWFVLGVLLNFLWYPCQLNVRMFDLDNKEITKQKETYKNELTESAASLSPSSSPAQHISTNDIITSWIATTFKIPFCLMVVNIRGRLAGITDNLAGNYDHAICFTPQDAAHPAMIRESLAPMRTKNQHIPTPIDKLRGGVGVVSNWCTFQKDIQLEGAETLFHFPLVPVSGWRNPLLALAVIFRPCKNKTAVLVLVRGWGVGQAVHNAQDNLVSDLRVVL